MKGKLLLLLLIFHGLLSSVVAQTPLCDYPNKGAFSIAPSPSCVGEAITVTNSVVGGSEIEYVYDWNKTESALPTTNKTKEETYTYTKPGDYTILQFGSKGQGFASCVSNTVKEIAAPNVEVSTCKDGRVRITLINDEIYKAYDGIEIDWGNGTKKVYSKSDPIVIDQKYSGIIPTITIRGHHINNLCDKVLKTKVISGEQPATSLESIRITRVKMSNQGEVNLLYTGIDGIDTKLFIDKGDGQFVDTGINTSLTSPAPALVNGLDPTKSYNFKLISTDICGNPVESDIVSSVVLKGENTPVDETTAMSWTPYSGSGVIYQIFRNDGTSEDAISPPSVGFFMDDKVKCGKTYTYKLLVTNGSFTSESAEITLTPKSTPPGVIPEASVTVDGSKISTVVDLTGMDGLTSTYNIIVERAQAGSGTFVKISPENNQSVSFIDENLNTGEVSYCYRFSYENTCKQVSKPTDAICSIVLKNNLANITWTSATPFTDIVGSYELLSLDASGTTLEAIQKNLETSHSIDLAKDSKNSFKIKANSNSLGLTSYSNIIRISGDVAFRVPGIFTPNNDQHNELFLVKSFFTESFKMFIYNRWGEVIFTSENATKGWDGLVNSREAPSGYYIYKIEATTMEGQLISKTGSFLLVR